MNKSEEIRIKELQDRLKCVKSGKEIFDKMKSIKENKTILK